MSPISVMQQAIAYLQSTTAHSIFIASW